MKPASIKPLRLLHKACGLAALAALTACTSVASHAAPITVKLIGFNDFHGTLQSPGTFGINTTIPSAQRPAVGGAEYLAAYVARMKATNPPANMAGSTSGRVTRRVVCQAPPPRMEDASSRSAGMRSSALAMRVKTKGKA